MSIAKTLYDALVAEYSDGIVSITSLSKPDQVDKYFIEADYCGLNFDNVKNYASGKPVSEMSPDTIFLKEDELYFVEFKSGSFEKKDLRGKINEGLTTLYQFAISRKIIDRDSFFSIPINYVVIATKNNDKKKRSSSFADALNIGAGYFGLKNMEGFLLKKTSMLLKPESIYGKFQEITCNGIEKMTVHCPVDGAIIFNREK